MASLIGGGAGGPPIDRDKAAAIATRFIAEKDYHDRLGDRDK
jgi:hypothetical protein